MSYVALVSYMTLFLRAEFDTYYSDSMIWRRCLERVHEIIANYMLYNIKILLKFMT